MHKENNKIAKDLISVLSFLLSKWNPLSYVNDCKDLLQSFLRILLCCFYKLLDCNQVVWTWGRIISLLDQFR